MNQSATEAVVAALKAMDALGRPRDLITAAAALQTLTGDPDSTDGLDSTGGSASTVDEAALREHLTAADLNDRVRTELRSLLARWDAAVGPGWAEGTPANTTERRAVINRGLRLGADTAAILDEKCSVAGVLPCTVIAREWEPWYNDAIRTQRAFYWNSYTEYLHKPKRWPAEARAALDLATTGVVERLADPTRPEAYKAKGLVVGYVQSGKTANFTGVVAKAIDAGYRLVIVLTGTTDILRAQTQRRLDMELVGRENILAGIDETDDIALQGLDYQADDDWIAHKFVEHGCLPRRAGRPNIHRLTTLRGDYRSLQQGIIALDFPLRDENKPIYDPENLYTTDARLAVVKKNATVLRKLVADLRRSAARIEDLPVLIVDDESDQASVNTSNPAKWRADQRQRTSINKLLSELLTMLPRAQYIGYTATPFANVFIDPSDAEDLFPNDFIIALPRTPGYMGATDFHDLDSDLTDEERDYTNSNEKAHVRALPEQPDENREDLREAIDMYLLTGAVKLYREDRGLGDFRHHTMLVHENMRTDVQREQAQTIRTIWNESGYFSHRAQERLRTLFEHDLLPVMRARAEKPEHIPGDYATLAPFVAQAVARVGTTGNPVLVVNSDKIEGEAIDFDQDRVWRILVGGNKLARGFTVEGLTVSYYRRMTKQGATLMQMGRWFGYRKGYRDLVRLYVTGELHTAFEAVCRDEDYFRRRLDRYAELVDGRPQITPAQVAPLVAQHLPWLKPDAPNKMYNAELVERRSPGDTIEPLGYPDDPGQRAANVKAFHPILRSLDGDRVFRATRTTGFTAHVGIVDHATFVETMQRLHWQNGREFTPDLRWLATLDDTRLRDWLVLAPQLVGAESRRRIDGFGPLSTYRRDRRRDNRDGQSTERAYFGAISDSKHRNAASLIAGVTTDLDDPAVTEFRSPHRGAMLLYPVVQHTLKPDPDGALDPTDVVMGFQLHPPVSARPEDGRLVTFRTIDSSRPHQGVIDLT